MGALRRYRTGGAVDFDGIAPAVLELLLRCRPAAEMDQLRGANQGPQALRARSRVGSCDLPGGLGRERSVVAPYDPKHP